MIPVETFYLQRKLGMTKVVSGRVKIKQKDTRDEVVLWEKGKFQTSVTRVWNRSSLRLFYLNFCLGRVVSWCLWRNLFKVIPILMFLSTFKVVPSLELGIKFWPCITYEFFSTISLKSFVLYLLLMPIFKNETHLILSVHSFILFILFKKRKNQNTVIEETFGIRYVRNINRYSFIQKTMYRIIQIYPWYAIGLIVKILLILLYLRE